MARKMVKLISPTGKVHLALVYKGEKNTPLHDPLCNSRTWQGDVWGKDWPECNDDKEITCQSCLKVLAKMQPERMTQKEIETLLLAQGEDYYRDQKRRAWNFKKLATRCEHRTRLWVCNHYAHKDRVYCAQVNCPFYRGE